MGASIVDFASRGRRTPIRLCVIDVDGTLLTSRHELTAATAAAVERASARGVQIVLATSRGPVALKPVLVQLDRLRSEVFIASQGALTARYGPSGVLNILAQHAIPIGAAHDVTCAAVEQGIAVNWYTSDGWYVSHVDHTVEREARVVGVSPVVRDLMSESAGPDKLMLVSPSGDPAELVDLARELPAGLRAQISNPTYLEITRADVDKAMAVAEYCRTIGIGASDVLAIGDGPNDLAVFAFAGVSVAPANARPEVLAAADIVTASNDEDGVALVLDAVAAG
jgi:Cof subfamily protein (haloacid dehalogenase superfamily)